jgi:hypothetical protein
MVAMLLVLLAGCAQSTQGSPTPGGSTNPATATEDTSTTEAPPSSTSAGVASLQPCEILDQADLTTLQLTGGEQKKVGSARVCRYQRDGATLNETYTVSVELYDNQGLTQLNADVQPLPPIGGHDAVRYTNATGTCGVSLGVGDDSRVDNAAVGGDQQQGCQIAEQLATIVERKLP